MPTRQIETLSRASDQYGRPYLLGFMERYNLRGLIEATDEQADEYIQEVGLLREEENGEN